MLARPALRLLRPPSRPSLFHVASPRQSIFLLPIDANASTAVHAVPNLDAARLWDSAPASKKPAKAGTTRIFYATPGADASNITALTSLGENFAAKPENEKRELVRKAVGSAVKQVKALGDGVGEQDVLVDAAADPHAAAVAANLALYDFSLKTEPPSRFAPSLKDPIPERLTFQPISPSEEWNRGVVYAQVQNLARTLSELPGNMMTPTIFTERIKSEFADIPNVEIAVRDEAWATEKGMRSFLSVSKGSSEPAKFLEIHYTGAAKDIQPLMFVGKGVTFDSGGISLKPVAGMKLMRGDMGGAAAVCAAALAVARLQFPINLVVLAPLTENLPGPSANKPGDIVYAMNGKSVEIDNTDAEGRLVLADALYYGSTTFKPHSIVDVATLTGAMNVALGEIFTGVFTNSDELWQALDKAGAAEHDRFWRMPLDDEYGPQIKSSNADLCNSGGRAAGSCTAALFLKAFVEGAESADTVRWAHLDIAGTMGSNRGSAYMGKGLTGRPTRALIEFARRISTSGENLQQ